MDKQIPLTLSESSPSGRVIVGLSWDMRELEKIKLLSPELVKTIGETASLYVGGIENAIHAFRTSRFYRNHTNPKDTSENPMTVEQGDKRNMEFEQYDLDLKCYIFDAAGNNIEVISPIYTEMFNDDMSAFHSGEDYTGVGPMDDEDISLKMRDLPDDYHHLLFVVKSDCAFDLDKITNPVIRIYDAYTSKETVRMEIKPPQNNASAYIFAAITRDENQGWGVNLIEHYCDYNDDFVSYFRKVISSS